MKEKLKEWDIEVKTPYSAQNLQPAPDLVIVGNAIRKDNPEATYVRERNIPYLSFPNALGTLFLEKQKSTIAFERDAERLFPTQVFHARFVKTLNVFENRVHFETICGRIEFLSRYGFGHDGKTYQSRYFVFVRRVQCAQREDGTADLAVGRHDVGGEIGRAHV